MIRGVNKQIIEISETGDKSFERAILFVRPDCQQLGTETLRGRALGYLSQLRLRPWFYGRGSLLRTLAQLALGAMAGAVVTAVMLL